VVVVLLGRGTPPSDLVRYSLFLVVGVVAPGLVLHKGLRGSQGSWLSDVGLGAATGSVMTLVAWAVAGALSAWPLMWCWPVLSFALLLLPSVRERVRQRPRSWGGGPALALTGAVAVAVWQQVSGYVSVVDLPPSSRGYYPDLLWHLGLAAEATRSVPLQTPQLADAGPLRYHWFANAEVAASSLMSGVEVQTVMLRLWVVPAAVLAVVLTAALAEKVSGSAWVAAAAGWAFLTTAPFPFWPSVVPVLSHLNGYSPSQLFAYGPFLLALHALVDVARGSGARRGAVAVAMIGCLGASGAKSSALPVLLGGLGVAVLAALVHRRRRAVLIGTSVVVALLTAAALRLVAGGSTGSGIQLLSNLTVMQPYRVLARAEPDFSTLVPSGLVSGPAGPLLLVALLLALGLASVRNLGGLHPFTRTGPRHDLGVWLLAGASLTAFLPLVVIGHSGYSEYYFLYTGLPAGCVLTACWVRDAVTGQRMSPARVARWLAVGAGATVLVGLLTRPGSGDTPGPEEMRGRLVLFVVVVLVVAAGALALGASRRCRLRAATAVVLLGVLAGSAVLTTATGQTGTPLPHDDGLDHLAQSTAAVWIREHVPADALLATNEHCLPADPGGAATRCDSRRWWLSGLSGRRVLVESWDYDPASVAAGGYRDGARLAANQAAFSDPSPATLGALADLGVTWLVAEGGSASGVSPDLPEHADLRFRTGAVSVYSLR
jgi:hypothetical protein